MKQNTYEKVNKVLSLVLSTVLIGSLIDTQAFAAVGRYTYNGETFGSIKEILDKAADDGAKDIYITLNSEDKIDETIEVKSGENVKIAASKKTTVTVSENTTLFKVESNATLSLQNIEIKGNMDVVDASATEPEYEIRFDYDANLFESNGEITLTDSVIRDFSTGSCSIFKITDGTLCMNGNSEITNVTGSDKGSTIYAEGDTLIQGGIITKSTSELGGAGVYSGSADSNIKIDGVEFADVTGCAVIGTNVYVRNCSFINNLADSGPSAIKIKNGEIINSCFENKETDFGDSLIEVNGGNVKLGGITVATDAYSAGKEILHIGSGSVVVETGIVKDEAYGEKIELMPNAFEVNSAIEAYVYVEKDARLEIKQARFESNASPYEAVIRNYGELSLHNVKIADSDVGETSTYGLRRTVTKGDGVYNEGTLNLYSGVNISDNSIYLSEDSELVVKEDLIFCTESNRLNINLEEQIDEGELKIAQYDTENSEESAYKSTQSNIWSVETTSEEEEVIAASGDEVLLNADTISRTIHFVDEDNNPVSGIVYELFSVVNGEQISLGYTSPSDGDGMMQINGLCDGDYSAKFVTAPTSVEMPASYKNINFKVNVANNTVTSGSYGIADNMTIRLSKANEKPIAVIHASKTSAKVNEEIEFDATQSSDDVGIVSYKWTFGDGTTSTKETVKHSFSQEGRYDVMLTVKDNKGKASKKTVTIVVQGSLNGEYKLSVNIISSTTGEVVDSATMVVADEEGNEKVIYADDNGVAETYLKGNCSYEAYFGADNYYSKSINVNMEEEAQELTMYLSDLNTVVTELEVKRMTLQEIKDAGIDVEDEENINLYKHEAKIEFTHDESQSIAPGASDITIIRILDATGQLVKEEIKNDEDETQTHIQNITDGFYLAVRSETTWLKEMFDVQIIVLNNSKYEEMRGCKATIALPEGLSLATMAEGDNKAEVELGDIAKGESKVHHWYVRGDKEGSYIIGATLSGKQVSYPNGIERITDLGGRNYMCVDPIVVLGGSALALSIMAESIPDSGDYVDVTYTLYNVSPIWLYNVTLKLYEGDEYRIGDTPARRVYVDSEETISQLSPGGEISVSSRIYLDSGVTQSSTKDYYVKNIIQDRIGGNMGIDTAISFHFVPSRNKKSTNENENVAEAEAGDPVDLLTGAFTYERSDATIIGQRNFALTRIYGSSTGTDGSYGYGWRDDFTYFLSLDEAGNMAMNFPNGDRAKFEKMSDGGYISAQGSELSLEVTRQNNSTGTVEQVGDGYEEGAVPIFIDPDITGATVTKKDGTVYTFNKDLKIIEITTVDGYKTSYDYNDSGQITKISTATGEAYFVWNENGRISKVIMSSGETVEYGYNDAGYLETVKDADENTMRYEYNSKGYLTLVTDFLGNDSIRNEYDRYGRVTSQYLQGEGTYNFAYDDENRINTCTGENGYVHTITYDDSYRIIEDVESGETRYTYNDNSWRTSETDSEGNVTTYEYDTVGNITKINYADKTSEQYKYNEANKIVEYVNRNGDVRYYTYDDNNRLKSYTDFLGNETAYVYDENGNIVLEIHADGGKREFTYDDAGRKTSEMDENGNTTLYEYDEAGRTKTITSSDGDSISYTYSKAGKLLSETDGNGNTITYTVNANGYNEAVTDKNGGMSTTTYNAQNKGTSYVNRLGKTITYTYDEAGNVTTMKNQRARYSYYEYDAFGRIVDYKDTLNNRWMYEYDTKGNLTKTTNPLGDVVITTYDSEGRVKTITDENGAVTSYEYDGEGNIKSQTDALGNVISYECDNNGNITKMTDALGNTTSYEYDSMNRIVCRRDALGNETHYTYDLKGQVKTETDPLGNITSYDYDSQGRVILITDALGGKTAYTYDSVGNVKTVTDSEGGVVSYEYDANGNLKTVTNERGIQNQYEYDAEDQLTRVVDGRGNSVKYGYDNAGNLKKITNEDGTYTSNTYDAGDRVISMTNEEEISTGYEYDALGRVVKETAPDGSVTSYTYDKVGNLLTKTDAKGNITSYTYDSLGRLKSETAPDGGERNYAYDAVGNVKEISDALGNKTTYEYDALGRISTVTDALGQKKIYEYDAVGNVTSVTDEAGNVTLYEYDGLSRIKKLTNAEGETMEYTYDSMGRVTTETRADGKQRTYTYDLSGNVISETDFRGKKTAYKINENDNVLSMAKGSQAERYTYDKRNRITKITYADKTYESYTYDSRNNVTSHTDRNGNITTYTYDNRNNMIKSTDAEDNDTDYEYDANGNITRQILHRTTEGQDTAWDEVTVYEYDECNRLNKVTDALGNITVYDYDLNGNLSVKKDGEGNVLETYGYDALGRLVSKTAGGEITSYEYNETSAVTAITSSTNDIRFVRDRLDRITKSTQNGKTVNYTYDEVGNKSRIKYPDGTTNKLLYTGNGTVYLSYTDDVKVKSLFDSNENMTSKEISRVDDAGEQYVITETENYTYDSNGRMLTASHTAGDKTVVTDEYTYDNNGNVLTHMERNLENDEEILTTYTYDSLNRLASEVKSTAPDSVRTYEYDSVGNLVKESVNGADINYSYNNLNQLTRKVGAGEDLSYTYDVNGGLSSVTDNITSKTVFSYDNDSEGRMMESTRNLHDEESTSVYEDRQYDDRGYVTKTESIEYYTVIIDGWDTGLVQTRNSKEREFVYDYTEEIPKLIATYDSDGTVVDYYYATDRISTLVTNENGDDVDDTTAGFKQAYALNTDRHGTTRWATDSDGNIVADTTYGTWGELEEVNRIEVSTSITVDITSSYTGYNYDDVNDVWNAGERIYDAAMKHFTSKDPEAGNVYEKMRVNAYVYANNNPTTYTDPNGRSTVLNTVKNAFVSAKDYVVNGISNIVDSVANDIQNTYNDVKGTFDVIKCRMGDEWRDIGTNLLLGTVGAAIGVSLGAVTVAGAAAVLFAGGATGAAFSATEYFVTHALQGDWDNYDYTAGNISKFSGVYRDTGLELMMGGVMDTVTDSIQSAKKTEQMVREVNETTIEVLSNDVESLELYDDVVELYVDEGSSKTIDDIIDNLPETTNGKGVARNFESTGGFEQTIKDFDALNPVDVKEIQTQYGPGKVGKLSDGTTVVARPGSTTGGATLEIRVSNSKVYKIRY